MLPAQSQWIKAEAIINEILVGLDSSRTDAEANLCRGQTLSPTTVLWRRLIRLMIARGGGHGEIMQGGYPIVVTGYRRLNQNVRTAFVSCFKLMPPDEQEGLWSA